MKPLVEVQNVKKDFYTRKGTVKAIDNISLQIPEGIVMGLVGESGCGKTTLARIILRLLEPDSGKVIFDGENILTLKGEKLKEFRRQAQIIFQDPFSSLNPRMTVGDIVSEGLLIHNIASGRERQNRAIKMLEIVGLPSDAVNRYPHEFSGGQRQRIGIARALILEPKFIICDEPVSSLDVSVQTQILNLLCDLKDNFGLTLFFIAHNLAVIQYISDLIGVMYLGQVVEVAPVEKITANPLHPYTKMLFSAAKGTLPYDTGEIPSPLNPPKGCRFNPRCPFRKERCQGETPPEIVKDGHKVVCWLYC
jgi:oligopeptide/dipeptide ABC transporter ATP-binding protein